MRILRQHEINATAGGDNDGDEGEAEARAFYEQWGTCEQWTTAEGDSWYSCNGPSGTQAGNVGGPGSAPGMPDSTNRTPDWGPNAPRAPGLDLTRPRGPGLRL